MKIHLSSSNYDFIFRIFFKDFGIKLFKILLSKAAARGHSMYFMWNNYPHTISCGNGSKLSVVLICVFIYRAPHIGFYTRMAIFWSFVIRSQYIFWKKWKSSKNTEYFFQDTKASTQTEYFLKNFSNRVASDRKPSMYFFRMLWKKTLT